MHELVYKFLKKTVNNHVGPLSPIDVFLGLGQKRHMRWEKQFVHAFKEKIFSETEEKLFTLIDSDGNPVEEKQFGLLLYRGGTVCDDGFDDIAAEAVCRQIKSSYSMLEWTTAETFDIQNNLDINLNDVQCNSTDWGSCEYSEEHNCGHGEDVFLSCTTGTPLY